MTSKIPKTAVPAGRKRPRLLLILIGRAILGSDSTVFGILLISFPAGWLRSKLRVFDDGYKLPVISAIL